MACNCYWQTQTLDENGRAIANSDRLVQSNSITDDKGERRARDVAILRIKRRLSAALNRFAKPFKKGALLAASIN